MKHRILLALAALGAAGCTSSSPTPLAPEETMPASNTIAPLPSDTLPPAVQGDTVGRGGPIIGGGT